MNRAILIGPLQHTFHPGNIICKLLKLYHGIAPVCYLSLRLVGETSFLGSGWIVDRRQTKKKKVMSCHAPCCLPCFKAMRTLILLKFNTRPIHSMCQLQLPVRINIQILKIKIYDARLPGMGDQPRRLQSTLYPKWQHASGLSGETYQIEFEGAHGI